MFKKGLFLAVITAFISGVSNFVGKIAVSGMDPLLFTTLKNFGAFALLFVFFTGLKSTRSQVLHKPNRNELRNLLMIALIGGSIPFYLFFEGLRQIPAINGALIHKSLIVWVALMAWPILGEKLSQKQLVGVVLLFFSNFFIGGFTRFTFGQGELMVLAATLLWSVENIIAKKTLSTVSPAQLSLWRMGGGGLILLAMILLRGTPVISLSLSQLGIVVVTSALLFGYVATWYQALATNKVTTVACILVSATVITNALSAVFVTHTITLQLLSQAIAIVAGVALVVLTGKKELDTVKPQPALS